jgi:Cu+-exporting ATPase
MTCTACVSRITRALKKIDGVRRVKVDLAREMVTVEREPAAHDALLAAAMRLAGYEPDLSAATEIETPPPLSARLRAFIDSRKGTIS